MRKSKSSYEKLKDENQSLRDDIRKILCGNASEQAEARIKWLLYYNIAESMWSAAYDEGMQNLSKAADGLHHKGFLDLIETTLDFTHEKNTK